MATKLSDASDKSNVLSDGAVETDAGDFDGEPEVVPAIVPALPKDPMIRRKIEDRLERIRLRDELGIYDDDQWDDL